MGKQLNYWMEYDSFLLVAQKAVDLGFTIVKKDFASGRVLESTDISIVTRENKNYFFHLPEAGDLEIRWQYDQSFLKYYGCAGANVIIEAGYSYIVKEADKKEIRRARIYSATGYYDKKGEYIKRPDCLTKKYGSLARYVKKVAPYTELTDIRFGKNEEDCANTYEYTHKEYITKACLYLRNKKGYKLV